MLLQNKDPALISHQTGFGGQATQKGDLQIGNSHGQKEIHLPLMFEQLKKCGC